MASVNSSSTRDEVIAAIADNASYREDNSVAKCRAYITALRVFINVFAMSMASADGVNSSFDIANQYRRDLELAERWLDGNQSSAGANGRYKAFSVESFRE